MSQVSSRPRSLVTDCFTPALQPPEGPAATDLITLGLLPRVTICKAHCCNGNFVRLSVRPSVRLSVCGMHALRQTYWLYNAYQLAIKRLHLYILLLATRTSIWCRMVAWHSCRTLVFDRRTFPVLRSTCSWRVTTYVSKPSAVGQRTRPTQPFIFSA